jgi:chemosensory pili system protein ChpA (sensor histidine kinase/response regulator)
MTTTDFRHHSNRNSTPALVMGDGGNSRVAGTFAHRAVRGGRTGAGRSGHPAAACEVAPASGAWRVADGGCGRRQPDDGGGRGGAGRFKAGTLKCSADHAQAVAQLYQALVEYLEELLEGAPSQPAKLFPYYRAVQEMLGWSASIRRICSIPTCRSRSACRGRWPPMRPRPTTAYASLLRARAAAYLKGTGDAGALLDAIKLVADAQQDGQARAFWLAMQAFAELVAGGLAGGLYVKQLFGLINCRSAAEPGRGGAAGSMLRDALFFVATAGANPRRHRAAVRTAFALDGLAPADYETRATAGRHRSAGTRQTGIAQAKAYWDRCQRRNRSRAGCRFDAALHDVAASATTESVRAGRLAAPTGRVARKAVSAGRSEELALEMATALLFAEHGLQHIRHLPDDFAAHADTIGALAGAGVRRDAGAGAMAKGLARQMQQDDTVVALAMEMKTGLRQVERCWTITTPIHPGVRPCWNWIRCCISCRARWRCWIRTMRCTRRACEVCSAGAGAWRGRSGA